MAKTAVKPQQQATLATLEKKPTPQALDRGKEVVKQKQQLPADFANEARATAGMGTSKDQADNLVPLIYLLQSLSPQTITRNPAYIDGAEAGDLWMRSAPEPIAKGEEGIIFQPCYFNKCVIEWIPRDDGGGFVARHDKMPDDAELVEDPKNPDRKGWVSKKTGHQYVETREHIGYVMREDESPLPYVIPMTGSNHKISREWMFLMNSKVIEGTNDTYGSFVFTYKLTSKFVSKKGYDYFTYNVEDNSMVASLEDMRRGKALCLAFSRGEKQTDVSGYAAANIDEEIEGEDERP